MLFENAKRTPGRTLGGSIVRKAVAPAFITISGSTEGARVGRRLRRQKQKKEKHTETNTAPPRLWPNESSDVATEMCTNSRLFWVAIYGFGEWVLEYGSLGVWLGGFCVFFWVFWGVLVFFF